MVFSRYLCCCAVTVVVLGWYSTPPAWATQMTGTLSLGEPTFPEPNKAYLSLTFSWDSDSPTAAPRRLWINFGHSDPRLTASGKDFSNFGFDLNAACGWQVERYLGDPDPSDGIPDIGNGVLVLVRPYPEAGLPTLATGIPQPTQYGQFTTLLGNPWVLSGLIQTGIAVPVAIDTGDPAGDGTGGEWEDPFGEGDPETGEINLVIDPASQDVGIPEPGSVSFLLLGGASLLWRVRRRRQEAQD